MKAENKVVKLSWPRLRVVASASPAGGFHAKRRVFLNGAPDSTALLKCRKLSKEEKGTGFFSDDVRGHEGKRGRAGF